MPTQERRRPAQDRPREDDQKTGNARVAGAQTHEAPVSAYVVTRGELELYHPDLVDEIAVIVDKDAFIKEMRARLLVLETLTPEEQKRVLENLRELVAKAFRHIELDAPKLTPTTQKASLWEKILLFFDKKKTRDLKKDLKEGESFQKLVEQLAEIKDKLLEAAARLRMEEALKVVEEDAVLKKEYRARQKEIDLWEEKLEHPDLKELEKELNENVELALQRKRDGNNERWIFNTGFRNKITSIVRTIEITVPEGELARLADQKYAFKASVLSGIIESVLQKHREQAQRKRDLEKWILEHHPDNAEHTDDTPAE